MPTQLLVKTYCLVYIVKTLINIIFCINHVRYFSSKDRDLLHSLNTLWNAGGPSDELLCCTHAIEVALASVSVCTHCAETKPISNLGINRDIDAFCNDVHTVAGHPE